VEMTSGVRRLLLRWSLRFRITGAEGGKRQSFYSLIDFPQFFAKSQPGFLFLDLPRYGFSIHQLIYLRSENLLARAPHHLFGAQKRGRSPLPG
jgi:hypothetical protein